MAGERTNGAGRGAGRSCGRRGAREEAAKGFSSEAGMVLQAQAVSEEGGPAESVSRCTLERDRRGLGDAVSQAERGISGAS